MSMYKIAAEIDEKSYESALSNIAHAYIHDKAPELLRHEIGFQLVEKSEDENRALGIFGFKIGNVLIYVPIFFIDGKIKGLDLMYIYNEKQFVPLSQEYIDFIKKNQLKIPGKPAEPVSGTSRVLFPNLMQLKPQTMKWAASLPSWLQYFAEDLIQAKTNPANIQFPDFSSKIKELVKNSSVAKWLARYLNTFPQRIEDIYRTCGCVWGDILKTAGEYIKRYPDYTARRGSSRFPTLEDSEQPAEVEIYTNIHEVAPQKLTKEEVQSLLSKGILIRDHRDRHNKIFTFKAIDKVWLHRNFLNPIEPGIHDILMLDGKIETVFIAPIVNQEAIFRPHRPVPIIAQERPEDLRLERNYLVIFLDSKKAYIYPQHMLVTIAGPKETVYKDGDKPEESEDQLSAFKYASSLRPSGKFYCFFTDKEATPPVQLHEYSSDKAGRIVFYDIKHFDSFGTHSRHPVSNTKIIVDPRSPRIEPIKEFVDLRYANEGYIVPNNARFIEINPTATAPATLPVHLLLDMLQKASDGVLYVTKTGTAEFSINDQPYPLVDFIRKMMIDYGLSQDDTYSVIKKASTDGSIVVLIKKAQELPPYPKSPVPPPSMQLLSPSPMVGSLGAREFRTLNEGLSTIEYDINRDYPSITDPLAPGGTVDQQIRAAIQTGQKEVLDTTLFSEMLSVVDDEDVIERYLPDLMKGVDALGRLLFNFYLHYDTFENRYGIDQLQSLEQNLRVVFHRLGKIILELEQRPVSIDNEFMKTIGLTSKG